MTFPSFVLGSIFAILYGSLFHLWRGGGAFRLLLFIILSFAGFWAGNWIANLLPISIGAYGPLQLGMATIGSIVVLFIGYWLSNIEDIKT